MGCDIHALIEVRQNGKWVCATRIEEDNDDADWVSVARVHRPCDYRAYGVFSLLANVRNEPEGHDNHVPPLAEPRGLPDDMSPEMARFAKCWDLDAHSLSYHTLAQLLAYDYCRAVERRAFVSLWTYLHWSGKSEGENPYESCADTLAKKLTEAEADKLIASHGNHQAAREWVHAYGQWLYVDAHWTQPVINHVGCLWSETLPRMFSVRNKYGVGLDDVRLVFFFDN